MDLMENASDTSAINFNIKKSNSNLKLNPIVKTPKASQQLSYK